MAKVAVSNSSPIIVLRTAGRLDLMETVFDSILVPEEVAAEVRIMPERLVEVRRVLNRSLLNQLAIQMDLGEAAAVALAVETPRATVILDDRKGRRAARQLDLAVVGTIGLVIEAKLTGRIRSAREVIDSLLAAGMFASRSVIDRALFEAGE